MILNTTEAEIESYIWNDGSTTPYQQVRNSGTFWSEVTDKYGCKKRDTVIVSFKQCTDCSFFIPTAFTPNSDGLNDLFRVKPKCLDVQLKNFRFAVFNKLGQLVFETNNINDGWNGKKNGYEQQPGEYVYQISYSFDNKPQISRGTVLLLR